MGKLRDQVMQEIDVWLEQQDAKRDAKLNKQRDRALERIKIVWAAVVKRRQDDLYGVRDIVAQITRYVTVYKWLPCSYRIMLRDIKSGAWFRSEQKEVKNTRLDRVARQLYKEQVYEAINRGGPSSYDRLGLGGPCVEDDYGEESIV
jgi:hypothetical protein